MLSCENFNDPEITIINSEIALIVIAISIFATLMLVRFQTRIMKEIGFELEEYVIWDRQIDYNNMKTLGYPYVFRFNKVHEFICIYWKR